MATDPQVVRSELVGDRVGNYIPVTWRGFRVGPVSPELGQRPTEITLVDDVRRVRLRSERVDRTPMTVVGPERAVPLRAGRDVNLNRRGRVERAAVANDLDRFV